jgi:hypothetical protein
MSYLRMTPPEDKETQATIKIWIPCEVLIDTKTEQVLEVFFNGENIKEYKSLSYFKEQLLDLLNQNK